MPDYSSYSINTNYGYQSTNVCPNCSQPSDTSSSYKTSKEKQLTEEEKKEVANLKKIDNEVRAHEQAHMSAGAGLITKGASFSYKTGPDGKQYAIGGEVSIDTSPVPNDPQATIIKMQRVQRAALAPAKPSGQDHKVASQASSIAAKARQELALQKRDNIKKDDKSDSPPELSTYNKNGGKSGTPPSSGNILNLTA